MSIGFKTSNDAIFELLVPFVVIPDASLAAIDRAPFGLRIEDEAVISPLKLSSETFLTLLQRLDGYTFGPEGMPMPRWVFFDCAELPAAIFGFAMPAKKLRPQVHTLLDISPSYDGLVPFSMYIALPMVRRGHWFGHNLSSLSPVLEEHDPEGPSLKGLGSITKALCLKVLRATRLYGATQWASTSLFIHSKFGPLDLDTAYTPAHSDPETLTYAFEVNDASLRATMGDTAMAIPRRTPEFFVASDDVPAMCALQDRIEAGERFVIPGPPRRSGTRNDVPIAKVR